MVGHHFKLTKINIHKTGPVLQSEPVPFHKIELGCLTPQNAESQSWLIFLRKF